MDETGINPSTNDVAAAPWVEHLRDHCVLEQQAAVYAYAMKLLSMPRVLNDALEVELHILAEQANKILSASL